MFPASLLITLLLALPIAATPVEIRDSHVTLPLAKRINASGGAVNLVKHDRARAAALKDRGSAIQNGTLGRRAAIISVGTTNVVVSYIAAVGVGSPATTYNLIVDTGSANTWVGAGKPYKQTSTSKDTGQPVAVVYGSAAFAGEEWTDTVSLGSGLTVNHQSIGVASTASGFQNVDGVLGLGPEFLTQGSLFNEPPTTEIPTVTQNLRTQGKISKEIVGVFFAPTTTLTSKNGELTFGGTDPTKYTGSISYTPLTTTKPAANYWGIDQNIAYGGKTILARTAGIVDTGSTMILIATDAFSAYQAATGGTVDSSTNLLQLTTAQYAALKNLNFHIGSVTFALTPNGQIWPRSLNTYIGGTSGSIYSIVNDIGTQSGSGLDFINGQTFLERFYAVHDVPNSRVGFATTKFTDATTN